MNRRSVFGKKFSLRVFSKKKLSSAKLIIITIKVYEWCIDVDRQIFLKVLILKHRILRSTCHESQGCPHVKPFHVPGTIYNDFISMKGSALDPHVLRKIIRMLYGYVWHTGDICMPYGLHTDDIRWYTSLDVRFWRLMSVYALKELILASARTYLS